jgi:outer membrane protein assembly factor BamB
LINQTPRVLVALVAGKDGAVSNFFLDLDQVPQRWQGPFAISSSGLFPAGAPITLRNQTPRVLVALAAGNDGAVSNFFLDLDQQPQRWQGPFAISPPGFALPGAPITLMNQTPRVLVALVVGKDGAASNFFLDLDQVPQRWQGPFAISSTGLFPAGAPITLMNQTPRVLVALLVGNNGALSNFFLDLDRQPQHWQGPFGISAAGLFTASAHIALRNQTPRVLVALLTGSDGRLSNFFLDLDKQTAAPEDIITQHNNNGRTGAYTAETQLTPASVRARGMQVKYRAALNEAMSTQPLYVRNSLISIPGSGPPGFAPPGTSIALMNQTPRVLVALVAGNGGAVSNFFLDLDKQPQHWQGPFAISAAGLFPAGARITLMNQTPRVLVALAVGNNGAMVNFFLDLDQQPQRWQGPFAISAAGLFPAGAPITLMNQTPRVLVALVAGNNGAVSNFFLDLDQQPQRWQGPFAMSATGLFPAGARITLMNQTPRVLVALVVDNNGAVVNFFLDLDQQPQRWQGPFAMSAAGLFPAGAPITLMNQTPRVLVALVAGNNGAVSNFFLDLDQQPQRWQGPFAISPPEFALPGTPITLMNQTPRVLVALVTGNNGAVSNFFLDLDQQPQRWQGPFAISPPGFALPGTPITLMNQTPRVLVALVAGNNGAVSNFFLDLDQQPQRWQGPFAISTPAFTSPGAHITLMNQTPQVLVALVVGNGGRVSNFFLDLSAPPPVHWQGPFPPNGLINGLLLTSLNNWVYAIDADSGSQLWSTQLVDSDPKTRPLPRAGISISATPVVDVSTQRIYVLFSTANQEADGTAPFCPDSTHPDPKCPGPPFEDQLAGLDVAYWLAALDYRNGSELQRVKVSASLTRSDGTRVDFVAKNQWDRPALLLDHGFLYLAFGSRPAEGIIEYHGWVIRYLASDFTPQGAFCTSKDATVPTAPFTMHTPEGAAIWGGGAGLSADADGNVYFLTGNGRADVPHGWFGDSFVRLNAETLTPSAFTPDGAAIMEENDVDLGAGGTMAVPNTHFVIGGGKTGYMYLMNRDSMSLVQQLTAATNVYHPELRDQQWDVGPHLHGSPNFWRGPDPTYGYLYVWGEKDALHQYSFNTQTNQFDTARVRSGNIVGNAVNMPGGMISISSNGNQAGTGVVWATMPTPEIAQPSPGMNTTPGHLYAYNAETIELLWDQHFSTMGTWVEPTIAGGNVFIGTSAKELIAYELGPASGVTRQKSISQGFRAPEPLTPLRQRYSDEASVRRLPAMALKQLEPGSGYRVSLALRGTGELLYRPAANGGWQLAGATAELWKLDPDDPSARKPALVRLGNRNTWTASDGSRIVVEVQKTIPSPDPTAASWTLFRASAHRGRGILTDVDYVQCVFTQRGLPPTKRSAGSGPIQRVPYEANYIFYSRH